MKLQLTKTKTIEINFPGGHSSTGPRGLSDVTGVVLNSGDVRGCPAVRLTRNKKGAWAIAAAGFVPPPEGDLPASWEEMNHQPSWSLPPEFQAPHAALSVLSPDMFIRQTSPDALSAGLGDSENEPMSPALGKKKLGIRRETASTASSAGSKSDIVLGQPVSASGTRYVAQPLAEEPFVVQTGLPEFQVLWLSRLLPEGKRPTAYSVQTLPSSLLAALSEQPQFVEAGGTAFAIYVLREAIYLAGYRDGQLLLFRQCPGVTGWEMMREGVKLRLGLDDDMVDSILDDVIVDPRSAMEPFVRPVLQQLEISLDYLSSRHGLTVEKVFLMGLPSGARYWSQMAEEALHLPLIAPSVFDGVQLPPKNAALLELTASQSQVFLPAFGAARAAMEGTMEVRT